MSVPPGYNAGESLLQGGVADISPVMGGGFIETNTDQSLLLGGEANIVPLKGGRRKKGYPTIAYVVTSLPGMKGGAQSIVIQKGVLPDGAAVAPVAVLPADVDATRSITEYIGNVLSRWVRKSNGKTPALAKIPTFEKVNILPENDKVGQGGFDRVAIILLSATTRIIVLPPVKGDIDIYAKCIAYINKYIGDPTIVIIFSPGFYGSDIGINRKLLYNFTQLKTAEAKIFILTHNTNTTRNIGKNLGSGKNPTVPLVNLLEPTYIVYPYSRLINGVMAGGIIFSGAADGEVDIPVSTSPQAVSVSGAIKMGIHEIAFPPNIKVLDKFNNINPYTIYRLLDPTNKLTTGAPNTVFEIIVKSQPEPIPTVATNSDKFEVTPDAQLQLDSAQYTQIDQDGKLYLIRRPGNLEKGDWIALKFTEDEANMLNNMKLRKSMMNAIFGDDWKNNLANFLENMVNSSCFIDRNLLTTAECDQSKQFIDKVFQYYLEHDERIAMLKVEEDAADYKQFQLAKGALDSENEAIKEELKLIQGILQEKLKDLNTQAELQGSDLGIDPAALLKDPFNDGRLTYIPGDTTISPDPYTAIGVSDIISRDLIALHKKSKQFGRASISVKGVSDKPEVFNPAIEGAIDALIKEYPGWLFITDMKSSATPDPVLI